LSSQATHLQGLVAKFKLRGQSSGAALPAAKVKPVVRTLPQAGGQAPKAKGWSEKPSAADQKEIINLDDSEFGKY
jgi:hypothetical protein